ncbi:nuclear transport factor 2 family protein [Pseudonocardia thermophila]|uniref:nuclear transport factor 2 family protein n=1 Tax=Pseudonocardia thermophila TaxID=1848 RepID=UPI001F3E842B|nr:nuclear transport factor 2 family protein [Pseudonocardia thermophila]
MDRYLDLCEERRLDEAGAILTEDARLVFPGGVEYRDLAAMVADARTRYRWARKPVRDYVVAPGEAPGRSIVICRGTLTGEWLDGSPFSGVRFVDIFVLRGDRIAEQHVYNDLAVVAAMDTANHHEDTLETAP